MEFITSPLHSYCQLVTVNINLPEECPTLLVSLMEISILLIKRSIRSRVAKDILINDFYLFYVTHFNVILFKNYVHFTWS